MIEHVEVRGLRVAIERRGAGRPLVFLHGWPFHRATWRELVPRLEGRFDCVLIDFPGLGDTELAEGTPIGFRGLAELVRAVTDHLQLGRYGLVAHDTGGTVARIIAAEEPDRITELTLLNTEMPGHRPPFIPFYQRLLRAPFAIDGFRVLLELRAFLRSP